MRSKKLAFILATAIAVQTAAGPLLPGSYAQAATDDEIYPVEEIVEETVEEIVETVEESDLEVDCDEVVALYDGESEFPAETMPAEIISLDTIYHNVNTKAYGFGIGIKTQDDHNEDYNSVKDYDLKDIRISIDNGNVSSLSAYYVNPGYTSAYSFIPLGNLDDSVGDGEHTIKIAIKRGEVWYSGETVTTFVTPDYNDQHYEINAEGSEPGSEVYFSGKKNSTIGLIYENFSCTMLPLNANGHQLKSIQMVKHGSAVPVNISFSVHTGIGSTSKNPMYYKYRNNPLYPYGSKEYGLYYALPNDMELSLYGDIRLNEDVEEGWYDLVAIADNGMKATFENAYYATSKPLLWGMGYTFPWYYGELIQPDGGDYVCAYVYGLNISSDIFPVYYDGETAMTGEVYQQEPLLYNGGFAYLLKVNDKSMWNNAHKLSFDMKTNIPDNVIDLRSETEKNAKIDIYDKVNAPDYYGEYWADKMELDYYGNDYDVKSISFCDLDSMVPLVTVPMDVTKTADTIIPAAYKNKFSKDGMYRMLMYNSKGCLVVKTYINRFATGTKTEGQGDDPVIVNDTIYVVNQKFDIRSADCLGQSYKKYEVSPAGSAVVSKTGIVTVKTVPDNGLITISGFIKDGNNWKKDKEYSFKAEEPAIPLKTVYFSLPYEAGVNPEDQNACLNTSDLLFNTTNKPDTWISSKKSVADYDPDTGLIYAKANGTAKLTAVFGDPKTKNCAKYPVTVKVKFPKISKKKMTLQSGATQTLKMTNLADGMGVVWKSTTPEFVTVDPDTGLVSAVKYNEASEGIVEVYPEINGKKFDSYKCVVTVKKPKLSKTKISVKTGKNAKIALKNTKLKASDGKITFESDNPSIAVVDAAGAVTGVSKGECNVKVTVAGIELTCVIKVN